MGDHAQNPDAGGRLKIFLGYAPGVGKSFAMLDEALRRKKRGQDVVIGYIDGADRPAIQELLSEFEIVPPKRLEIDGKIVEEMDTDFVLKRRPEIVLVDNLSHMNAPGAVNEHRWQDVRDLLDARLSVITTLNIQNLESLNDQVAAITGTKIRDTVPDFFFSKAEEVELVDLTPRALINRLERGDIYPLETLDRGRIAWFTEGNLSALRELALREVAGRVDLDVEEFRKSRPVVRPWAAQDRVMICISPTKPSMRLVRRGWRIAQRLHADVVAVTVEDHAPSEKEKKMLRDDFALAERLQIHCETLKGPVASTLIQYAKEHHITHLVIGYSDHSKFKEMVQGSILSSLARELKSVDIMVVASDLDE